jgi:TRAP-type mannitol/chloroaromatic compound transport system substrate-binding protein
MKRRHFLTTAGLSSAIALSAQPAPAQTPTPTSVRWRMATSYPKSVLLYEGAQYFCEQVSQLSEGRFTITPYPAGELVPPLEVIKAVGDGTVECGYTIGIYAAKDNPALAFATGVPFGLNAQQQNAWLYSGGGLDLLQKLYQKIGCINFPAGSTGNQMGGWFRKEIKSVADLKGLKMRIPGLGGQVMTRLGVEVQVIPATEIVEALVSGKIEAVEFTGPHDDRNLGLHKAASFYYYPGWWEATSTQEAIANLKQWQQLSPEFQEIFKTAAAMTQSYLLAAYNTHNSLALQKLLEEGTQLKAFSPEILQACQQAATEHYEELSAKDADFKSVYQPWKAFRDRINAWHRINELSFAQFVLPTISAK